MNDVNTAVALFQKRDWPSFEAFWAGLTDDQLLALLFEARFVGCSIVGYMLCYNPPKAVYNKVKATADQLGVQVLSQTDRINCIPLHWALQRCTVVAVVESVIKGTPPSMLKQQASGGYTPLDYLNVRDSSLANTVEITALFQSVLSVSVCAMLYSCDDVPPTSLVAARHRRCTVYSHNLPLSPLTTPPPTARFVHETAE